MVFCGGLGEGERGLGVFCFFVSFGRSFFGVFGRFGEFFFGGRGEEGGFGCLGGLGFQRLESVLGPNSRTLLLNLSSDGRPAHPPSGGTQGPLPQQEERSLGTHSGRHTSRRD